ncbi:MAG: hypothetical protein GY795_01800 [Desulfobacterales bacterium]|nr:hypothetical protein [Desulfobacterales bacterium]
MDKENRKREIKAFLAKNGIRQVDIAKEAEVAPSAVSAFIRGTKKHGRVKETLIKLGVPRCLLDEVSETVTVKQISSILGISECGVRKKARKEGWYFKKTGKLRGGGFKYVFPIELLPPDIQKAFKDNLCIPGIGIAHMSP